VLFVLLVVGAAMSGFLATPYLEPATLAALRQGLAALAAALFVTGGFAYLLRWKLTGEAPVALVGVALLVYGVGAGMFIPIGPTLVGERISPSASGGLVRAVVTAVAIYLLVRSLSSPVVESDLRPGRLFLVAMVGIVITFAALGAVMHVTGAHGAPARLDIAVHAGLALGWAFAAVQLVRRAVDSLQGDVLWVGLALGTMAVANTLRVVSGTESPGGLMAAVAVTSLAAGVALFGTSQHLTQIFAVQGAERMRLYVGLVAKEAQERSRRASAEERLHDARSTLAAVRFAAGTLQRYDDKLAAEQRESLTAAVTNELVRLEHLIDPPAGDQLQTFLLEPALSSVVETERALGTEINVQLRRASAYGRPDDVARIVHNLLTNARRHAPGSPVRLSASTRDGFVSIAVGDEGPGVPASQREAIFERGRHSKAGGSTGLGLYVARHLARELGGDLTVHDRVGGGATFLLRVPSVPPKEVADEVTDLGDGAQDKRRRPAVRRPKHGWLPGPVGESKDVPGLERRLPIQGDHLHGGALG
jgi:two-component system OmpR family sensor kinase